MSANDIKSGYSELGTLEDNQIIIEDKKVEQNLRTSEDRFRATFEQAAVGLAHLDLDGNFLSINQKFCEIVGYSQVEMSNLNFQDITHPDELEANISFAEQLMDEQITTYEIERRFLRKDGLIGWANLTVSLLRKEKGEPDCFIAVVQDITDRKEIEQLLYESELKYRTVVERANDGIAVVQEGEIVFANPRLAEITDYTIEELLHTNFTNYIAEDELPKIIDYYQRRIEGANIPTMYETAIKNKNGSRIDVEFNAGLTRYDGTTSTLVIIRDITERKKTEKVLRESEERFRTTFEQAAVGIAHVALDGTYLRLNQKLCNILGYSHEELLARPYQDHTHPDDLLNDLEHKRELLAGQIVIYTMEKRYFKKDGQVVWANLTVSLLRKETGEPNYFIVVVEDITQRKEAEQALRERKERYQIALESGLIILWQVDLATGLWEFDGALQHLIGYSPDEMTTGMTLMQTTHPDDIALAQKCWEEFIEENRDNYSITHRVLHKDGSVHWVEVHGTSVRDEHGQIIRVLGTSKDITATKQAEEMVTRSQAAAHIGSWELDLDTNRLIWSEEVNRIFGGDPELTPPTYEGFLEHVHHDDRAMVDTVYWNSVREGKLNYEIEHRLVRPDTGEIRWVLEKCDHLSDPSGRIVRSVGMVQDITERKLAEEALYQSREQLAILNHCSQTINMAGLNSSRVFTAVRAACAWLVPADVVTISLVNAAGEVEDVFLMDRDHRLPGRRYPLRGSFIGQVLAEAATVRENDFQAREAWPGSPKGVCSGLAVPLRGSEEALGVLTVESYTPNAYSEADQSALESFAAHVSITIENIRSHQQLERSAVIEERQRLASELHDSVTQLLYSIAMMCSGWGLKASKNLLTNPADHFYQIEDLSLKALREMRVLIHQLRPPALVEVGLLKAIEERLEMVERRVDIDARLLVDGPLPRFPALVEADIYSIILEALNNSLRHARAAAVQVSFHTQDNQLRITIVDNGRGYEPSITSKGMGTAILDNRAAAIGAAIHRESHPGQGTRVELMIDF